MEAMNRLKSSILNYIKTYNLSNEDVSNLLLDELINYYVLSLGINIEVFDEFISSYLVSLGKMVNLNKSFIYDVFDQYDLFEPNNLLNNIIEYIDNYETTHKKNLKELEEQISIDEENKNDNSIPLRQSEAYADLAYSKLLLSKEINFWSLCQSTKIFASSVLEKIKSEELMRGKVDY